MKPFFEPLQLNCINIISLSLKPHKTGHSGNAHFSSTCGYIEKNNQFRNHQNYMKFYCCLKETYQDSRQKRSLICSNSSVWVIWPVIKNISKEFVSRRTKDWRSLLFSKDNRIFFLKLPEKSLPIKTTTPKDKRCLNVQVEDIGKRTQGTRSQFLWGKPKQQVI